MFIEVASRPSFLRCEPVRTEMAHSANRDINSPLSPVMIGKLLSCLKALKKQYVCWLLDHLINNYSPLSCVPKISVNYL